VADGVGTFTEAVFERIEHGIPPRAKIYIGKNVVFFRQ